MRYITGSPLDKLDVMLYLVFFGKLKNDSRSLDMFFYGN